MIISKKFNCDEIFFKLDLSVSVAMNQNGTE